MPVIVEKISDQQSTHWDNYVLHHSKAHIYHLHAWSGIIQAAYGHKAHYLVAKAPLKGQLESAPRTDASAPSNAIRGKQDEPSSRIVGILPLFHLRSYLFGNNMFSIPFFDMGGVLAESSQAKNALISEAIELGRQKGVQNIELRQHDDRSEFNDASGIQIIENSNKVRMVLTLPESSEVLMKGFKSKLRSQIKRPIKEGLVAEIGTTELISDFYRVFTENMRDLGSPVHSIRLIANVLEAFEDDARIVIVYKDRKPLACGLIIGYKKTMANPWASALRKYSRLSPNMLLYWTMLAHACDRGYREFDFGRSTPGEGTYRFKSQWGAEPRPLNWAVLNLSNQSSNTASPDTSRFDLASRLWQRLPVAVSRVFGPIIRKHISL